MTQAAPAGTTAKRPRRRAQPLEVLPTTGHVRLRDIMAHLRIGRSTWWRWVKDKKVPAPIKLSAQLCVWRAEDIHQLIRDRAAASASADSEAAAVG
jgi:predicted DNA-binding transcriptional regulator AlpA